MIQQLLIIMLAANLVLFSQPAHSSGGGITSIGPLATGAVDEGASREWVKLVCTGGLLIGRPTHKYIKLITVYAPGCDEGHLILRELKLWDGRRSSLFTAPDSLLERVRRATIYVKHPSANLVLLEEVEGDWKLRTPQPIPIAAQDVNGASQGLLLAFSVEGLGLYWLLEGDSGTVPLSPLLSQHTSPTVLVGGGIFRGLWHWGWPVLLLGIGWLLSQWVHKTEGHNGM